MSGSSTTRNPVTWLLTRLIDLYRLTAPMRAPRCRFHPSCSTYGREALLRHGPVRGLYLTVRRLLRCHPWNPGGVDHVPPRRDRSSRRTSSHTVGPSHVDGSTTLPKVS